MSSLNQPGRGQTALSAEVVLRPAHLTPRHIHGRSVVVLDVLRATTSIIAALAAGLKEIRIFGDIESAVEAAKQFGQPRLLCGEARCLPPAGFDLGNSPGGFQRSLHSGRIAFMATSNGTRAIIAARGAEAVLIGALVNASALAAMLVGLGRDVTLLCAGTDGEAAMEDVIGAGAVLSALGDMADAKPANDAARMAQRLFTLSKHALHEVLVDSTGGRNLVAVGLEADIDFCATLDSLDVVGQVHKDPLRVTVCPKP